MLYIRLESYPIFQPFNPRRTTFSLDRVPSISLLGLASGNLPFVAGKQPPPDVAAYGDYRPTLAVPARSAKGNNAATHDITELAEQAMRLISSSYLH